MKITWIGHSCFKVEKEGFSIVIDPYKDSYVPGLKPVRTEADRVLCTHEHADHNFREGISIVHGEGRPLLVEEVASFHDDENGKKRGENRIFIISDGEERIAHFGDLGTFPENLELFKGLDAVLIPVGGYYTIDGVKAAELIKRIKPRIAIPMHFKSVEKGFGFDVLSTVKPFRDCFDRVLELEECTLDTRMEYGAEVVILTPENAVNR